MEAAPAGDPPRFFTPECHNCGSSHAELKCGRCKLARYCTPECQRKHWLLHKPACGTENATPLKLTYDDFAVSATELGHGNFSTVYKATHKVTRQAYALKVLDKAKIRRMAARHPSINLEVMQEKHLGLLLSPHPGIARLHLTFQDDGRLYYLYDLVPGGELWTFLTAPLTLTLSEPRVSVPASTRVASVLTSHVVDLLEYLHRMGVVHRDLKPENILVTLKELRSPHLAPCAAEELPSQLKQLTLIDFATAKDVIQPTHNSRSEFIGTPDYMPPEAIDNRGFGRGEPCDTRADLWSLGCLIYQILAGLPPFRTPGAYSTFQRILRHAEFTASRVGDEFVAGMNLEDGSPDIDGLLFPPIFNCHAESLVLALLRGASLRLGCGTSSVEKGACQAGCDRKPAALPPPTASVMPAPVIAEVSPSAESDSGQSTPGSRPEPHGRFPAALHHARRANKTANAAAPGNPARRVAPALPPASVTVPSVLPAIDHGALRRHAFFSESLRSKQVASSSEDIVLDSKANFTDTLVAATRAVSTSNESLLLRALNHLAVLISGLKPVPLLRLLQGGCACEGESAYVQWLSAAEAVAGLDPLTELELRHILSLRRRLHVPHILSLFTHNDPAIARCVRWVGRPVMRMVEPSLVSSPALYRCGESGPREALGWNVSQSSYCFPPETAVRQSWIPTELREDSLEPGEQINDMGWRIVSSQDFHGMHYVVVVSNGHEFVEASSSLKTALVPLAIAINALDPAPRAVVFIGRLLPLSIQKTEPDGSIPRADSHDAAVQLRQVLSGFSGALQHEATSVVLATDERLWSSAALLSNHAQAVEIMLFGRLERAIGVWLSGVRFLICDADIAVRAAQMKAIDTHIATHIADGSHSAHVQLPASALDADGRWLLDALEYALSGSHHTVVVLRDSSATGHVPCTRCFDVSDHTLAELFRDSNVRCVIEPHNRAKETLTRIDHVSSRFIESAIASTTTDGENAMKRLSFETHDLLECAAMLRERCDFMLGADNVAGASRSELHWHAASTVTPPSGPRPPAAPAESAPAASLRTQALSSRWHSSQADSESDRRVTGSDTGSASDTGTGTTSARAPAAVVVALTVLKISHYGVETCTLEVRLFDSATQSGLGAGGTSRSDSQALPDSESGIPTTAHRDIVQATDSSVNMHATSRWAAAERVSVFMSEDIASERLATSSGRDGSTKTGQHAS